MKRGRKWWNQPAVLVEGEEKNNSGGGLEPVCGEGAVRRR